MLWIYAIVRTAPRRLGTGARRERLQAVRAGAVWAVAGVLDRPLAGTLPGLRAHDRVVRRLARTVDALLPARFGSAVEDASELGRLLRGRGPELRRALALVRGHSQWTVRGLRQERLPRRPPSPAGAGRPGARYLAKVAGRYAAPELDPVRAALAPHVHAERVTRHEAGPYAFSAYHLVSAAGARAYRRALRDAAARAGLKLVITGPHPPYAFGG
jgi:hypothetical protein